MSYNLVEIDPISGEHKLKKVAGLSKLNVWTGTQSDYNAQKNTIPNGSYVNITDDAESGNGIKDIYSTDEVKTNKVWIDGKPIYRKVISSSSFTASLSVSIPNIKEIVNITHQRRFDSRPNLYVVGDGVTNSNSLIYSYGENAINISTVSSGIVIYDYVGIIEYTKN